MNKKKQTNKLLQKKIKIFIKQISVLALFLTFAVIGVSGALVNYLSNTISADITVESPIELDGSQFSTAELGIEQSGEDGFTLIKLTNKADIDIKGQLEIAISPDAEGISIAISKDMYYCFNNLRDMTGITDCEEDYMLWMENNRGLNDWYANEEYDRMVFISSFVVDTGGNTFYNLGGYVSNKLILPQQRIPAEETIYYVVYIATSPLLTGGTYTFDVALAP